MNNETLRRLSVRDTRLDCLVIGYNDDTDAVFRRRSALAKDSVPKRIFERNHIRIDGVPLPYIDLLNHFLGRSATWRDERHRPYYHVGEISNYTAVYLANFLLDRGFSARQISLFNAQQAELLTILEEERPRVVAVTTTFYDDDYMPATEIVRFVKEHAPESLVVLGGPLVRNAVDDHAGPAGAEDGGSPQLHAAFEEIGADFYIHEAQGEQSLLDLVRAVRAGDGLDAVPNLFLKRNGRFRLTFRRPELNCLDACAISWNNFDDQVLGPTVQVRTARGCAHACAFCDYPSRAGGHVLARIETVRRELRLLQRAGVRNIVFLDDTFNVPHRRFRDLCQMMIDEEFGFRWFSYLRCSSVTDESTFHLMKDSGCAGVFLGIESADPTVLRNMHKAATVDQYRYGLDQLHKRGILTFTSFIAGFPGETAASLQRTADFINETQPTFFRIEPWWCNPNTPIGRRSAEFGISGIGYEWSHRTMTARDAADGIDHIFSQVRGSWWCPQQSFSFWALPYLIGKGMDLSQVSRFLEFCHHLLPYNKLPESQILASTGRTRLLEDFEQFIVGLALEKPRFFAHNPLTRALAGRGCPTSPVEPAGFLSSNLVR